MAIELISLKLHQGENATITLTCVANGEFELTINKDGVGTITGLASLHITNFALETRQTKKIAALA